MFLIITHHFHFMIHNVIYYYCEIVDPGSKSGNLRLDETTPAF